MKTSIRLLLTALAVCGITYAAVGAPLPSAEAAPGASISASPAPHGSGVFRLQ